MVATGGLAELIAPYAEAIDYVEPWLTLHGLRIIYERNVGPADGAAGPGPGRDRSRDRRRPGAQGLQFPNRAIDGPPSATRYWVPCRMLRSTTGGSHHVHQVAAGVALTGALALGSVGVAAAATPSTAGSPAAKVTVAAKLRQLHRAE